MLKRHLPVLVVLAVLALIGYLVIHPPGSKPSAVTPPPAPRDPKTAAEHCFLQDGKVAPDGSVSFQAIFSNASFDRIAPSGTIDVSVIHTEGWHRSAEEKAAKPLPDETIVCTMKAEVGPGSYVDASQASVTGRFDKPCPTAAMPGRFVMLRGHLTQSDGSALCEYSGEIPAALGGEDKTAETLEGDLHRRAAADAASKQEGRFTSGRYRGAMFIVDRVQGKLACAGSYAAVNRKTEVKSKQANEIHRLVDADLAGEASDAAGALLKRIAPGLRVAEGEAM